MRLRYTVYIYLNINKAPHMIQPLYSEYSYSPDGNNLSFQLCVLPLQLLHLLLHLSGSHPHHLVGCHTSGLQLFLQRAPLMLQSA